ncbi:MAG TPA: ATP-binding protein [Candidatus Limnocylindrales bacterium]|nr:ATP-binding protein [Candidatus Limnocylindrales bacterium]
MLIVFSGLPGTGKSTLAGALGRELGAVVLSVDPIEAAMLRSGVERSFASGLAAYAVASEIAAASLGRGMTAIVDAVSAVAEAKRWWPALAERAGVPLVIVECVCSDEALHRARLAGRDRGLAPFPEPGWSDVQRTAAEWEPWDVERLVVDAVAGVEPNLAKVRAWVAAAGADPENQKRPKEPPTS